MKVVNISDEQHRELKIIAAKEGVSLFEIIERLLRMAIDQIGKSEHAKK